MRTFVFSLFISAMTSVIAIDGVLDIQQLKSRLQSDTGYVRSFSGVRFKNMGLSGDIAYEDRIMAFVDGYSYAKFLIDQNRDQENYTIILASDTRPTGKAILYDQMNGVIKAASEEGRSITLINLGVATTPFWESAVRTFKADGGIMVTASHNPFQENGWKYADSYVNGGSLLDPSQMAEVLSKSETLFKAILNQTVAIDEMMHVDGIKELLHDNPEHFEKALNAYIDELRELSKDIDRSIRLVNDSNGGSAARINTLVLQRLGFTNIINLNTELGIPSHKIEPIKGKPDEENDRTKNALIDVTKALKESGAKVGIVYDCDADRGNLVILDRNNEVDEISPQDVSAFNVAMALLPYYPRKPEQKLAVVAHCATSGRTKEIATILGSEFKTVEVGEVNVSKKMNALEKDGYIVPIGVEGYNGGTIFQGSQCRDGLQTLLSAAKALSQPHYIMKWIEAKNKGSRSELGTNSYQLPLYLSDFIYSLPRYTSIQDKRTGVRLNQKDFKVALEQALYDVLTISSESDYVLCGRPYKALFIEYISETEVRSREIQKTITPGIGLDGNFIEGGWRARLVDHKGNESTLWVRGSKTENGTYRTLADAQTENEANDLNFLLHTLFDKASASMNQ